MKSKVIKNFCKDILLDCLEKHILGYDESIDTITLNDTIVNISDVKKAYDAVWSNNYKAENNWKKTIDSIVFNIKALAVEMHRWKPTEWNQFMDVVLGQ